MSLEWTHNGKRDHMRDHDYINSRYVYEDNTSASTLRRTRELATKRSIFSFINKFVLKLTFIFILWCFNFIFSNIKCWNIFIAFDFVVESYQSIVIIVHHKNVLMHNVCRQRICRTNPENNTLPYEIDQAVEDHQRYFAVTRRIWPIILRTHENRS